MRLTKNFSKIFKIAKLLREPRVIHEMNHPPYLFTRVHSEWYTFTSQGKQRIEKGVSFTATDIAGLYNIGFGDVLTDGGIDDMATSNNGDIVKVMATVVQILRAFTAEFPAVKVIFVGSTEERTRLYRRILRTYYNNFSEEFIITGSILQGNAYVEIPFDPAATIEYHAFFIKRI